MPRRSFARLVRLTAVAAYVVTLSVGATAADKRKPTITRLKVDPSARQVELFDAIEEDELAVTMIAKDSKGGNLLIENKTQEPLTVQMPAGFVGVHVHKQIGGLGGGLGGGGLGGLGGGLGGGGLGGGGLGGGGGQGVGGGLGGGGLGGGLGGGGLGGGGLGGIGGGGGFFSIPAETVARVPYKSVCLNHGKAEPNPKMHYEIRPVDSFTDNETLQTLIGLVGTGNIDPEIAQAAAWHLSDGMSWAQLANMREERLDGRQPGPYFSPGKVNAAQTLTAIASEKARELAASRASGESDAETVSTEATSKIPGTIR